MEDVAVGDLVGWHIDMLRGYRPEDKVEMTGRVVAVDGGFLAIRSCHVDVDHGTNPFHGRHRSACHMVKKKEINVQHPQQA